MRGKPASRHVTISMGRNIPAHAGKTFLVVAGAKPKAEHPRACGENGLTLSTLHSNRGTSPRMRGKPEFLPKMTWLPKEHPRACGENIGSLFKAATGRGTSPRMRGKPNEQVENLYYERNIPAHAGKTSFKESNGSLSPEHPRACGENSRPLRR